MTATRRPDGGFTLIEILVVMVIIGIMVGLVLQRLGSLGDDRELEREAARLVALMELAHEEAALQGREYGIRFGRDDYAFLDYDPATGAWLALSDDDLFRARQLPEDATFELWLEQRAILLAEDANGVVGDDGRDDESAGDLAVAPPPHVALLSSGETTPFVLRLDRAFATHVVTVRGDAYGGFDRETGDAAAP